MVIVAFRAAHDSPWSIAPVRSTAEGLACSAALLAAGYRTHVFDHESIDAMRARDGFADAVVEAIPETIMRVVRAGSRAKMRPAFTSMMD